MTVLLIACVICIVVCFVCDKNSVDAYGMNDSPSINLNYWIEYKVESKRRVLATYSECPYGFVIPEDPNNSLVQWVKGTNCAVGCKSPVLDEKTWNSWDQFANVLNIVSFVGILLLLVSFWCNGTVTSVVLIASILSFISTFVAFVQHRRTFMERFCIDNAVPVSASDGITGCTIESFLTIYCALAISLAWAVQMVHIYLLVVQKVPQHKIPYNVYYAVIFLPPLVMVSLIFKNGMQGYNPGNIQCFTTKEAGNGDIWYLFFPIFIIGCIGLCTMLVVIAATIKWMHASNTIVPDVVDDEETGDERPSDASPEQPALTPISSYKISLKKIRALQGPLWFVSVFLFCIVGLIVGRYEIWVHESDSDMLFDEWVNCVFENYDGIQMSWVEQCGRQPESNLNYLVGLWFSVAAIGHSLFVTISFLNVRRFYSSVFDSVPSSFRFGESAVTTFYEFEADDVQSLQSENVAVKAGLVSPDAAKVVKGGAPGETRAFVNSESRQDGKYNDDDNVREEENSVDFSEGAFESAYVGNQPFVPFVQQDVWAANLGMAAAAALLLSDDHPSKSNKNQKNGVL